MNLFEIVGQAQLLRDESNRQLAAAMAAGLSRLARRIAVFFGAGGAQGEVQHGAD